MKRNLLAVMVCLGAVGVSSAWAEDNTMVNILQEADASGAVGAQRMVRTGDDVQAADDWLTSDGKYRTIDGSGNNLIHPEMGAADTELLRKYEASYGDGASTLSGADRPNPRAVSNGVVKQGNRSILEPSNASDMVWQWGQFLDHDIGLTETHHPVEPVNIPVPAGDRFFDPDNTGEVELPFLRSIYELGTGTDPDHPREQLNEITAWIDASNVYGSDEERATELRTNDGTGQLAVSEGNLLPFNVNQLPNAGGDSPELLLAGDVRANEQAGLATMHNLFVREHNRLAVKIAADDPSLTGEEIYQKARKIVGAQMQAITYNEFLPLLIGKNAIPAYAGYNEEIDGGMINVVTTAFYRLGHTMLSSTILRLDKDLRVIPQGNMELRDAFFNPTRILEIEGDGLSPTLRGLACNVMQKVDPFVVDDVRNFLFGAPGAGGMDLPALNIQRGRDHGLTDYNTYRVAYGLAPVEKFSDISSDRKVRRRLRKTYGSVDLIDPWVGALSEDRVKGALVGELLQTALAEQFANTRDGDRFWYELTMSRQEIRDVKRSKLGRIIRRNTDIGREIPVNVFVVPDYAL